MRPAACRSTLLQVATVAISTVLCALLAGCAPEGSPPANRGEDLTWRFTDPALACDDDGNVYIAGTEQFPETSQIFLTASSKFGEQWSPHFEYVNRSTHGERRRPQLVAAGNAVVYVLWEDTRDGPLHIYFNRSLDGARSWLPQDRRVNALRSLGRGISSPRMVANGRDVCVVWLDDREGFEAFYANCSQDGGDTWMAQDIRITHIDLGHKSAPSLTRDKQGGIYLAWSEMQGSRQIVRFAASQDHGRTWSFQVTTVSPPGTEAERILPVGIAVLDPGVVVLSWTQYRNGKATTYVARSEDRGRSWPLSPVELLPGRSDLFNPSAPIVRPGGFDVVHIAWQSVTRNGTPVVIIKSSGDRARSFTERRLTRPRLPDLQQLDFQSGKRYLAPFSMQTDGSQNVYLSWIDVLAGRGQVGFQRLGEQSLPPGLPTSGELQIPGHEPATLQPPQLCADLSGHVYILWNEARTLTFGASPFYGDTGWRIEHF